MGTMRILGALGALTLLACTPSCCDPCTTPEPAARLVLEHDCVGPYILANNKDADNHLWNGVMVQLGKFDGVSRRAESIQFEKDGVLLDEITLDPDGDTVWVNMVSSEDAQPMTREEAAYLYPGSTATTACDALDACVASGGSCLCSSGSCPPDRPSSLDGGCIRARKLHSGLQYVTGVITYWQAEGAYDATMEVVGEHNVQTTFAFPEGVRIDVDGETRFRPGEVDRIVVKESDEITHGNHSDPPWPDFGP